MVEFIDNAGLQHDKSDPVAMIVYSYGGCTTCGNSMWNWFRQQNLDIEHHNVQIGYEKDEATRLAMEQGYGVREVRFPLMIINGKVIIDFKPYEILAEINKLRGSN